MARNRQRFVEKWAAALEAHDAPDKSSLAGVERAMARAEAFAARCRERRGVEATQPVAALDTFAPELQQRRHLAEWRELNKAYAAYLTGLLEAAETDRDRWRDACAAQEDACVAQEKELAVHRARSRTFAALERIWRQTYRRLSGLFDRLHLT